MVGHKHQLTDELAAAGRGLDRGRHCAVPHRDRAGRAAPTAVPGRAASARTLALDRTPVAVLAVLAVQRANQRQAAGVDRPEGFVFADTDGRPYSPDYLTHHFRARVKRYGLPPIRFHDVRHGAATLALAAGADLKAIQDILGHASIVLTADTYTSVLPEVARQTAEGIAALVLAAGRNPPGRADGHRGDRLDSPPAHHGPALPADRKGR